VSSSSEVTTAFPILAEAAGFVLMLCWAGPETLSKKKPSEEDEIPLLVWQCFSVFLLMKLWFLFHFADEVVLSWFS